MILQNHIVCLSYSVVATTHQEDGVEVILCPCRFLWNKGLKHVPNYQGSPEVRIHKLNSKIMRDIQTRLWHPVALWSPFYHKSALHLLKARCRQSRQSNVDVQQIYLLASQLTRGLKIMKLGLSPISSTCRGKHG